MKTLEEQEKAYSIVIEECEKVFLRKNSVYDGSFFAETSRNFDNAFLELRRKIARIQALEKKDGKEEIETLRDTLIDLANYCMMTVVVLDNGGREQ